MDFISIPRTDPTSASSVIVAAGALLIDVFRHIPTVLGLLVVTSPPSAAQTPTIKPANAAAIDMYLAALKAIPANGTMTDDAKGARQRLVELVKGEGAVDERLKLFRRNTAPPRTVEITNAKGEQGITQYTVLIDANSMVTDFSSTVADDQFLDLHDAVRSAVMPQSFPDDTLKELPRIGTLSRAAPDQACLWTLVPVYSASRLAPAN